MDLKEAILKTKEDYQKPERQNEEKEVIEKYSYIFHSNNLDTLSKEDFKSFLLIKNNKHWDGIHRQGNMITQDMDKLKNTLKILLDDNRPLKERLDFLFPKNKPNYIKGLGRAIVTPILMVAYPTKYSVYNNRSVEGLRKTGLEPKFSRGASFSEKYIEINKVLCDLASENDMALFQLDDVWWKITEGYKPKPIVEEEKEVEELSAGFGLELHLHSFLVANWDSSPFGKNYEILTEDGDIIEKYQIEENGKRIGEIDILAKDKKTGEWVVIELKKDKTSDAVIGQTLRYMGWVEKNKVEKGEGVKGIIIVKETDEKLEYALSALKDKVNISCFKYNVQFSLSEVAI